MRILVPVKRCPPVSNQVQLSGSGETCRVVAVGADDTMNPFCAIALEKAVQLKEDGHAQEVITLSIDHKNCDKLLQKTLALGADRALHYQAVNEIQSPLEVAQIIAQLSGELQPQLILVGKQSVDYESAQVGAMIAALLNWPQALAASTLEISAAGEASASCESDTGEHSLEFTLPAVVSADLRLSEPRTASLANVVRARRQSIEVLAPLNLEPGGEKHVSKVKLTGLTLPHRSAQKQQLHSVEDLAKLIRETAI